MTMTAAANELTQEEKALLRKDGYVLTADGRVGQICWKCEGTGQLTYHLNVAGGACFACRGSAGGMPVKVDGQVIWTKVVAPRLVRRAISEAHEREEQRRRNGGLTDHEVHLADLAAQRERNGGLTDHELEAQRAAEARARLEAEKAERLAAEKAAAERAAVEAASGPARAAYPLKKRATTVLTLMKAYTFDSQWGTRAIIKFLDQDGIALTWKTGLDSVYNSGLVQECASIKDMAGTRYHATFTVADYSDYRGEHQVEINRVKAAELQGPLID